MAVGQGPATENIGLEHTQLKLDSGYMPVDPQRAHHPAQRLCGR